MITIYKMYDPRFPENIRYIGRTKKNLSTRLTEHLSKAKYKYGRNNHRINWINKLLKDDIIPIIEKIDEHLDWSESHSIEKYYINEYLKEGHDLVNSDDRGEGSKNKIITKKQKIKISNTLKEKYKKKQISIQNNKKTYVFDIKGNLLSEHESMSDAARTYDVHVSSVKNVCYNRNKFCKNLIFSFTKTINIPQKLHHGKSTYLYDENFKLISEFERLQDCADYLNCSISIISKYRRSKKVIKNTHFNKKFYILPAPYNSVNSEKV